jgi:uncharacterized membrane protein YtjA (UPF0391 family)
MLHWIVIFLGIALVAGLLGFRGVAATSFGIAEVLVFVLVIFIIVIVVGVLVAGIV